MRRISGVSPDQVSIRDVAELAGVSLGTVSNVLNRPSRVAELKRVRVQDAIEELGFVRNDAARQLKAGHSDCIGFLTLDVRNPFFTDVARGAEQQAGRHGLSVLLANSDDSPQREAAYLDLFGRQRVRGVLVSPIDDVFEQLDRLKRHGIVPVLVDRVADGRPYSSVSVDDVRGGYLAVTHLIEQGCRRIAYVGGPIEVRQVADRLSGARLATGEHPGVQLEVLLQSALDIGGGAAAAVRRVHDRPTSRPRFSRRGQSRRPLASSVRLDAKSDLLMEQVGAPEGSGRPRSVVFSPELVVRASSLVSGS